MTQNNWPNVDQSAFPHSTRGPRRSLERSSQGSEQIISRLRTVSDPRVKDAGVFRKSFAQPLVAIRTPGHDAAPPLMRRLVRNELVSAVAGAVCVRDHQESRKPLSEIERVKRRAKDRIRILAEEQAEVANRVA